MTSIRMELLGGFDVTVSGELVPARAWTRKQAATLVKLLALRPERRLHREQVLDLVWPDDPMDTAAAKLHKAAHYARKVTGHPGTIVLGGDVVQLFPDIDVSVDAIEFEQAAAEAIAGADTERAAEVARLYRGDLLPDDIYEDWAAAPRERLRQLYVGVLTLLERWQDVVTVDPGDERAHLELMRQFVAAGDRYGALRQYDRLDRTLRAELGVQPGRDAVQLRDRLLHQEATQLPEEESLVGRAGELVALERMLDGTARRGARTVILSGEPGIGKTALLRRMTDEAAARGWRVGVGVGASVEGAWAYAPLLDAVADLCRRQPALLDGLADLYRQEIDRVLAGVEAPWSGRNTHQRLFVAVAELLRLAAATTGAVLAIDDVQDADEATLRLLHYLPRALAEANVVLLLAHRTGPPTPATLDQLRTSLLGRHGGIELELAPLDGEAIDELVGTPRARRARRAARAHRHALPRQPVHGDRAGRARRRAVVGGRPRRPRRRRHPSRDPGAPSARRRGRVHLRHRRVRRALGSADRGGLRAARPRRSPCGSWSRRTPASASGIGWSGTPCGRTCPPIAGSASTVIPLIASRRSEPHRPGSAII